MEYVINFNYVKLNDSIIQVKFVIAKISNYYCRYVDFSLMLYQFLLHASWSSTVSEFFLSELRPRNFSGSKSGQSQGSLYFLFLKFHCSLSPNCNILKTIVSYTFSISILVIVSKSNLCYSFLTRSELSWNPILKIKYVLFFMWTEHAC